jgi:hypothetical protein
MVVIVKRPLLEAQVRGWRGSVPLVWVSDAPKDPDMGANRLSYFSLPSSGAYIKIPRETTN